MELVGVTAVLTGILWVIHREGDTESQIQSNDF